MPTLLHLNFDFPPMSGPGIWRALGFVKYLPEYGWRSIVVCSDRSPSRDRYDESLLQVIPPGTAVHRLSSRFEQDIADSIERRAERSRVPGMSRLLMGLHWRFLRDNPDYQLHWAMKAAWRGLRLVRRERPDCLYTSGPPHITHAAGLVIKRITGIPWLMEYRDLWTDDVPIQLKPTRFAPRIKLVERSAVQRSDGVVAVSPFYIDHLARRFAGVKPRDRYYMIRNGHDLPDTIIERSLRLPANPRPHFHFNGTPQTTHPFDRILAVVERLPADQVPLFTFTGLPPRFQAEVERCGRQDTIRDVGYMSQRDSVEYCLQCDVLLAMVNARNPLYRGTIPGKLYEAIALGRHVLAIMPPGSAVGPLVAEAGNGTVVDVDDLDALERAVLRIVELHRTGRLNAGQDPTRRRTVAARYSRRRQTGELVEILDRTLRLPRRSLAGPAEEVSAIPAAD